MKAYVSKSGIRWGGGFFRYLGNGKFGAHFCDAAGMSMAVCDVERGAISRSNLKRIATNMRREWR